MTYVLVLYKHNSAESKWNFWTCDERPCCVPSDLSVELHENPGTHEAGHDA